MCSFFVGYLWVLLGMAFGLYGFIGKLPVGQILPLYHTPNLPWSVEEWGIYSKKEMRPRLESHFLIRQ